MPGVVKLVVPVVKAVPPEAAAYQSIVAPLLGVAEIFTVPVPHLEPFVPVDVGNVFIVTDFCVAAAEQVVAVIVSVTFTVPAPAAPHVTIIEFVPVPAVIDPPTTVHEYVSPATLVTL